MKKLRFFSLQGISGILKLPKSLCKLTNLRILDLRACHNLEELPKGIGSLKKLIYLDLSERYLLDNMPKQLSQLSELKVLKGFVISKNSSCTLDKLAALRHLEKLSINVNNDKFPIDEAGEVFFKFEALQKLKIAWGAGGEGSTNGKKVNNGAKSTGRKNGKEKGNGKRKSSADKSEDHKKKESDAVSKSGPTMVLQKLVKLDLQCFPEREPPKWLVPKNLTSLKRLYIRGGDLSSMPANEKWEVETLRLKFLTDIKTNWKELQTQFPKLKYLEKVKCPQITFCPCDASGVWMLKQP